MPKYYHGEHTLSFFIPQGEYTDPDNKDIQFFPIFDTTGSRAKTKNSKDNEIVVPDTYKRLGNELVTNGNMRCGKESLTDASTSLFINSDVATTIISVNNTEDDNNDGKSEYYVTHSNNFTAPIRLFYMPKLNKVLDKLIKEYNVAPCAFKPNNKGEASDATKLNGVYIITRYRLSPSTAGVSVLSADNSEDDPLFDYYHDTKLRIEGGNPYANEDYSIADEVNKFYSDEKARKLYIGGQLNARYRFMITVVFIPESDFAKHRYIYNSQTNLVISKGKPVSPIIHPYSRLGIRQQLHKEKEEHLEIVVEEDNAEPQDYYLRVGESVIKIRSKAQPIRDGAGAKIVSYDAGTKLDETKKVALMDLDTLGIYDSYDIAMNKTTIDLKRHERELEVMKLENERLKATNERILANLRYKRDHEDIRLGYAKLRYEYEKLQYDRWRLDQDKLSYIYQQTVMLAKEHVGLQRDALSLEKSKIEYDKSKFNSSFNIADSMFKVFSSLTRIATAAFI